VTRSGDIGVLVVDDQAMVREGFSALLDAQPGLHVVGEAGDGVAAVELAAATTPDVVLMDVRMPRMDGLEATRRILAAVPACRVVVLTTFDIDDYVYEALRSGASGFVLKDAPAADLVRAVEVVAAGEALLAPTVTRRLIADVAARPTVARAAPSRFEVLTPREREVLVEVARGLSNAEIAARLVLAEETVKTHVGHILAKLSLRDRVQAVVLAYETGLMTTRGAGPTG
jgi:DNA-binding NarL/FixJ family response regulator